MHEKHRAELADNPAADGRPSLQARLEAFEAELPLRDRIAVALRATAEAGRAAYFEAKREMEALVLAARERLGLLDDEELPIAALTLDPQWWVCRRRENALSSAGNEADAIRDNEARMAQLSEAISDAKGRIAAEARRLEQLAKKAEPPKPSRSEQQWAERRANCEGLLSRAQKLLTGK